MKKPRNSNIKAHSEAMLRSAREQKVREMSDGLVRRAWTQTDGRKEASRRACRHGKGGWE